MYQRLPSWVLGFHGTDEETVKSVLNDPGAGLVAKENDYDWLGKGCYFWENDPKRALKFSRERMKWLGIADKNPAVIGAVIDLGHCLNLFDQSGLDEVHSSYKIVEEDIRILGQQMPRNENVGRSKDRIMRRLDCLVINSLHRTRADNDLPKYDTVRSPFPEGRLAYKGAGFRAKNHIQIAVCTPANILGYFLPRR